MKRVVRGELPWRYVGAVCEYIESPVERTTGRLDGLVIRSRPPGERQHLRWRSDRELLEAVVRPDPSDARSVFQLSRTLHALGLLSGDAELLRTALDAYERRAMMGGSDEEVFYSVFQAGTICEQLQDWPSACERYFRAWQLRPSRLESVYATAAGLLAQQLPRAAARFTVLAETTLIVPDDDLLVSPWVYKWGLLMLHSVATLRSGELDTSLAASKRLLSLAHSPRGFPYGGAAQPLSGHARQGARDDEHSRPSPAARVVATASHAHDQRLHAVTSPQLSGRVLGLAASTVVL